MVSSLALSSVLDVLEPVRDIALERVVEPRPSAWCEERGWAEFLLALDETTLERIERVGLTKAAPTLDGLPVSLRELARQVEVLTAPFAAPAVELPLGETLRGVKARKRRQIAAVRALARAPLARAKRVVEVGSGHGHLARTLSEASQVPTVGLEIDPARLRTARELAGESGPRFELADAVAEIPAEAGDLLVGLHCCGAMGDQLARRAAETGADALLVSCCLQKIPTTVREPLSKVGAERDLVLPKATLGLSNLVYGVTDRAKIMRGRTTQHALRLLLRARGVDEPAGDEVRGINRLRFRKGLRAVVGDALSRRHLAGASADELRHFEALGAEQHGVIRRVSLPRGMLGRVVELAVVLDRATHLEESGHEVRVVPVFPASISPRNLAIVATARPDAR